MGMGQCLEHSNLSLLVARLVQRLHLLVNCLQAGHLIHLEEVRLESSLQSAREALALTKIAEESLRFISILQGLT